MDDRFPGLPSGSLSRDAVEQLCVRNVLSSREERIFVKDLESRFLFVSEGWLLAEGRGRSLGDVIGRTDFEIFTEDHAADAAKDEQWVIRTGQPIVGKFERETFGDRPDAWVSTTKMPLLDEEGTIVGTWGIARDVTPQVQVEENIRRHAESQQAIADLGRLALTDVSLPQLFEEAVNAAWRLLLSDAVWLVAPQRDGAELAVRAQVGWPEEFTGEPMLGDECRVLEYAARSGAPVVVEDWEHEERFATSPRRAARGIRSSVGVLVGDPESPFGMLEVQYMDAGAVPPDCLSFLGAVANVLAETIQSRNALETVREQGVSLAAMARDLRGLVTEKERLIDQIPGVVLVFDAYPDGSRTFVYASQRSGTMLGLEPSELMADPHLFTKHVAAEDRERLWTGSRERAAAGREPLPVEFRFVRPDGQTMWLREQATLTAEDGKSNRVQAVLFDISAAKEAELERKRLEAELALAQKLEAVGQLAAGVAHEINTPIQFIGDSISFLKEAVDELLTLIGVYHELLHSEEPMDRDERQRRAARAEDDSDLDYLTLRVPPAFERALDGIDRVASIVGAMRRFAHPGTERGPVDVNEGIRTTLTVANNEYKYVADIDLDLGTLPLISANAGDLNQVFLNLIVNAAHAIETRVQDSGERGQISVTTQHRDAGVVITVSDTGCGIPAEIASRVFDPFFTTKPVGRGTGQGLAIVHSIIVERHHGAITFEPRPGGGTTFRIVLPIDGSAADADGLGAAA